MPPTRRLRMACDYGLSGLLRNTTFDLSLSQCRHRPQSTKVFKLRLWDARMHKTASPICQQVCPPPRHIAGDFCRASIPRTPAANNIGYQNSFVLEYVRPTARRSVDSSLLRSRFRVVRTASASHPTSNFTRSVCTVGRGRMHQPSDAFWGSFKRAGPAAEKASQR